MQRKQKQCKDGNQVNLPYSRYQAKNDMKRLKPKINDFSILFE
jgi:hypothetical protein